MSRYAKYYVFTGLLVILALFVALAMGGAFGVLRRPAFVVKSVNVESAPTPVK